MKDNEITSATISGEKSAAESAPEEESAAAPEKGGAEIDSGVPSPDVSTDVPEQKKKLGEMKFSECRTPGKRFAWLMNYIFIDGMSGMALGLFAFVFDTVGGVLFAKILNIFSKTKMNPMIGAAGISAFPMSARVIEKLGVSEDPTNHLLMHAIGANVSGQVASAVAGGIVLGFFM